ncbi:hypothetical protein [Reyranella sp.]|uniref:hypothetical protein n=1 Tax=Reyranella sp. TaxID=1929291 RepID=UPI003BA951DA
MKVGLDLDNTLICYDHAFSRVGREEGLLPAAFQGNKVEVKRALLADRADGYLWERLQGLVYGRRIDAASLFDGVTDFLASCRRRGDGIVIVSHKTEKAHHDPQNTDLRVAALRWMEDNGFFAPAGLGLDRGSVHFEATRDDKVRRIGALGCDVFIDDLAEVLGHDAMPAGCRKILFGRDPHCPFEQYPSWNEIRDALHRPS